MKNDNNKNLTTYYLNNLEGCFFSSVNAGSIEEAGRIFAKEFGGKFTISFNDNNDALEDDVVISVTLSNNRCYFKKV